MSCVLNQHLFLFHMHIFSWYYSLLMLCVHCLTHSASPLFPLLPLLLLLLPRWITVFQLHHILLLSHMESGHVRCAADLFKWSPCALVCAVIMQHDYTPTMQLNDGVIQVRQVFVDCFQLHHCTRSDKHLLKQTSKWSIIKGYCTSTKILKCTAKSTVEKLQNTLA